MLPDLAAERASARTAEERAEELRRAYASGRLSVVFSMAKLLLLAALLYAAYHIGRVTAEAGCPSLASATVRGH